MFISSEKPYEKARPPAALANVTSKVASDLLTRETGSPRWCFDALCGRLVQVEIDGRGASLSAVFELVLQAQERGEPTAWISATKTVFCPSDAADGGVDVGSLIVVRVRNVVSSLRAAERLLRSGAFGMVVLDLGPTPQVPAGALGKLVKLSQMHAAVVLGLTGSLHGRGSLGPMVSLRVRTFRTRSEAGIFQCGLEVVKDKRSGPNWGDEWTWSGPGGLR